MQIICKFHCPCICWSTPLYLYYIAWMFPQCKFNQQTAKGSWPTSDNSKRYWLRPRVGVVTRSCCISQKNQAGFEQMLNCLMNLLIFLMGNTFSWRRHSINTPPDEQNSSLLSTYSILVALSHPSKGQNFTSIPLTSSNQLHKCHNFVGCYATRLKDGV